MAKQPLHTFKAHHTDTKRAEKRRKQREKNFASVLSAAEMIGEVTPNCDIFGFTTGQFSMFDIIEHVMKFTGDSDLTICTWTAADASITRALEFVQNKQIKSMKWILDRSFISRQPALSQNLIDNFGDCIRTTRIHAKFVVIQNETWNIVIRASMNLNQNPRIENFDITDDKDLAEYFNKFTDHIYESCPPADINDKKGHLEKISPFDDPEQKEAEQITEENPEDLLRRNFSRLKKSGSNPATKKKKTISDMLN